MKSDHCPITVFNFLIFSSIGLLLSKTTGRLYAITQREKGKGILEAVVDAAQLRYRPILMTSIAGIAGFMPLVVASGAGAASQRAIGTAVVGGMIAATFMSLLFTPVFFVIMQKLSGLRKKKEVKVQRSEVQGSGVH